MMTITRCLIPALFLLIVMPASAQHIQAIDTLVIPADYKPEFKRERNHDLIDAEQKAILASDGKPDEIFAPLDDRDINFGITTALTKKVDCLQYMVETDSMLDSRLKGNYLKGLENILRYYKQNWKSKSGKNVNPAQLAPIINTYYNCIQEDRANHSIAPLIGPLSFDAATVIVSAGIFDKNPGYKDVREILVLKYCALHPEQTFQILKENPGLPFADSMVRVVSKKFPRQLYDYSQASNQLGELVRNIQDDVFIRTITTMSKSKSGQQYFPFLDNMVSGKITIEEIDAVKDDSVLYYRLLVKTQMDYVQRAINKDTAFEFRSLTRRMEEKAKSDFVNVINGLHDEKNPDIRFRSIQALNAQELYYLAVSSDGAIYTSSFVKGVYPLMMKKINQRGDSLLMLLNFDKYRKFIKMAAGFNTLNLFLASFPKNNQPGQEDPANTLMRAFVRNLEKTDGLEDGVDVADSYASIAETLKPVAKEMLKNIQDNYRRTLSMNDKKGIAIYNILNKLFLSADTARHINLTKELGIPPVYEVPFAALADDSGRVAIQLFIYGDEDGLKVFPGLLAMFANNNWKIDNSNNQWVTVSSAKGKPVSLYMNRPLPEETGEDAKAQEALGAWLAENNIVPTVTINRGHSYNAPYTIQQMSPASKIVFMGSCGGYRMIHDILEKAPDAHIIGTKQIADAPVNNPFLKLLTEKLRTGSNIEWIPFWQELDKMVTNSIFEDYVPPHKNLGALFIKAYRKAIGG